MTDRANFKELVAMAMTNGKHRHMRPVVEKELLHYDILFALKQQSILGDITFQGGTSLRLCYGSNRYSEDLDFAGGTHFSTNKLMEIKDVVERYVADRYGLLVTVKEPAEMKQDPSYGNVSVNKWQISVETSPGQRDIPRQRIKLEIASVPAYTRELKILHQNYDFLPDGYDSLAVPVESTQEILADKLVSLPTCTRYIRHRDIWDIAWLSQKGATLDCELIERKLGDYGVDDYQSLVQNCLKKLPGIVKGKAFLDQMQRFLPIDVVERTLHQEAFYKHLVSVNSELLAKSAGLSSSSSPSFPM
ncbi:nucleotidyl transferase AbiEii/AbiGii toxin family protein [Porticoccus sp. GXU_MW_L64]